MPSKTFPALTTILSLILAAISQGASAQTVSEITDLILVTGQSNVRGSQTSTNLVDDSIDVRVFAYTGSDDWEVADLRQAWDVDSWHPGNGSAADKLSSQKMTARFKPEYLM